MGEDKKKAGEKDAAKADAYMEKKFAGMPILEKPEVKKPGK